MSSDLNRYRKNKQVLEEGHLYSPKQEHDACGVGFVASVDGKQRREVVEGGIDALKAVWHRGAVDADGKTGDGAGILTQIPINFFDDEIAKTGHEKKRRACRHWYDVFAKKRLCSIRKMSNNN